MSSKIILTHSNQNQSAVLDYTLPFMEEYAKRHGYDIHVSSADPPKNMSPHWCKIVLLQQYLNKYDQVLWLDNDVLIRDGSFDIGTMAKGGFQALVLESNLQGRIVGPNTGVWLLNRCKDSREFLDKVFAKGQIEDASLHDQATVSALLGFGYMNKDAQHIRQKTFSTKFFSSSVWLGEQWNCLAVFHSSGFAFSRFLHMGGMTTQEKAAMLKYTILNNRLHEKGQ